MSGSNSSARAEAEPLGLTVHSLPAADLDARRTRAGRIKMLLVLLVCSLPVLASYFTYFVVRPTARTNYGTLIEPVREIPAIALQSLDGASVPARSLVGQWLLVVVGPAACDGACEKRLFMQRQLHAMLGRERVRVDKIWLITDKGAVTPALRAAAEAEKPPLRVFRADGAAVANWLAPAPGHGLDEHLYIVDPMGHWMMRMPVDPDPKRVLGDLQRLLTASAGWDRPGR
ncbi:MAG: hypothetical protein KGL43_14080 [Burkholderiales bacterium]|nr:hypothetical protein [Burkholderiales bacterium]MDE2395840.1 hypothetical protein [Burkholderiales bacterium]MDE2454717.1 hypothetical protein [Burkholderiales bacterium]